MNWSQLSLTWQFMYLTWFFWKLWVSHTSIISKTIVCSLNESSTHCLSFLAISAGTSHLVWQGDGDHRNSTINLKGERQILRVQYLTVVLLNCSGFSVATASPIFLKVFPWFLTKNDDLISLYLCGKRESEGEEEKETAGKKSTCCVYCFHFMYLAYLKYIDTEAGVKGWSDVDMPVDRLFSGVFMLRTKRML